MDDEVISDVTIEKLVFAAKRGVKVYVILEDLNAHLSFSQIKKLQDNGILLLYHSPLQYCYTYLLEMKPHKFF
jgi:hypothetical protein